MVYELGGYSSNSHFIWYLHGTLPFFNNRLGFINPGLTFHIGFVVNDLFLVFFLQNHDQPLTVKHFSLLKLWLSCEEWCSFRKFRSLIGGLEPWNFMTFHRLGIVTPTDKYFSEGWGIPPTSTLLISLRTCKGWRQDLFGEKKTITTCSKHGRFCCPGHLVKFSFCHPRCVKNGWELDRCHMWSVDVCVPFPRPGNAGNRGYTHGGPESGCVGDVIHQQYVHNISMISPLYLHNKPPVFGSTVCSSSFNDTLDCWANHSKDPHDQQTWSANKRPG